MTKFKWDSIFFFFFWRKKWDSNLVSSFKVYLVGWILRKMEKKNERKCFLWVFDWRVERMKNLVGPSVFSPLPPKCFLPKFKEKTGEKINLKFSF